MNEQLTETHIHLPVAILSGYMCYLIKKERSQLLVNG